MSAKQRLRVHSGPQQTQQITGRAFRISFHLDWQIDDGIYNRPIMAHTQILVQRWRPRTMISALCCRQTFCLWYRLPVQARLQGFGVKIAHFSPLYYIAIPRRDLSTKKTKPNTENEPESLR